jgi:hypothetical protein
MLLSAKHELEIFVNNNTGVFWENTFPELKFTLQIILQALILYSDINYRMLYMENTHRVMGTHRIHPSSRNHYERGTA